MHKLQLITEAKRVCPDVVIVLGEDLTRFRDASKQIYGFLSSFSWNGRCERLGFDEVWLDVSDIIASNAATLNSSSLGESFFRLSKDDPALGFSFDAANYAGRVYPETSIETQGKLIYLSQHVGLFELHVCASGALQQDPGCDRNMDALSHEPCAIGKHHAERFRCMLTLWHFDFPSITFQHSVCVRF